LERLFRADETKGAFFVGRERRFPPQHLMPFDLKCGGNEAARRYENRPGSPAL
jgi:hypothetical protein